jgi:hypothetical protein
MRYIGILALAILVGGCGRQAKDQMLPLDQVPENVMKVANDTLPDVKFDQVARRSDGRYEIRGKDKKGKVREVEISPKGEVLEIE